MPDGERGADGSAGWPLEARVGRRLVPGPIRRRYAAKFVLSLFLLVLVVAGGGGFTYLQVQGIIEEDAERTLRSTATLQADSVAEWTGGMRTRTLAVTSADVYASGNEERIRDHLVESRSVASEDVVAIHYVDRGNNRIAASTEPANEGEWIRDISPGLEAPVTALPADEDNRTVTMSEEAYEQNGDLRIAFAANVRGMDGAVVVVGDVRDDFEQLHETRSVATTEILDTDGQSVLAPRRNQPTDVAATDEFERAVAGDTTTLHRDTEVVAFAPVPDSPWVVSTTAPNSELYRASTAVGQNVLALVAASLLVLGLVGTVLWRQTVPPLVRLRRRAESMEDGTLDVDLRTAREDEIGQLFRAFAGMRDALREQIEAAEQAREETEQSRQELKRQNERLDEFASTVSHDLRNPLTVARGNLELVASVVEDLEADPETDADLSTVGERIETVEDAHERIATIIDDVLALARRGERLESTAPVDLGTVAREAWGTVDTPDASLTVVESESVEADRARLRRALENLFRNAVEHGSTSPPSTTREDADGASSVEPSVADAPEDAVEHSSTSPPSTAQEDAVEHAGPSVTVEVGLTDDGFYVADDGPGIPTDEVADVFEYGYSSDDGTGLGLSIVETIASAHGWTVSVDEDAPGATFVFEGVSKPDN